MSHHHVFYYQLELAAQRANSPAGIGSSCESDQIGSGYTAILRSILLFVQFFISVGSETLGISGGFELPVIQIVLANPRNSKGAVGMVKLLPTKACLNKRISDEQKKDTKQGQVYIAAATAITAVMIPRYTKIYMTIL